MIHYDTFLSTPEKLMHKVMDVAQRIGQISIQFLGAKGVNILTNCYEAAGQTVKHFHVHVIPRYDSDQFEIGWPQGEPDAAEQEELAKKLAARL